MSAQIELDRRIACAADLLREKVLRGEPVELCVETASMSGSIEPGDSVSLVPAHDLRRGDIVVFPSQDTLYAHRVVSVRSSPGGVEITTRGDRNPRPDPPVTAACIVGKVVSVVRRRFDTQRASLKYQTAARSLNLAREFSLARAALERNNIPCIPLKGISLYLQSLIDPGSRYIGDIDVLVRLADVPAALGTLAACGYVEPRARMRPRYGIFLNSIPLVKADVCLHLHWHLVNTTLPLFMYRVDMDQVWSAARQAAVNGDEVRFLSHEHEAMHLCLHAFNHSYEKPSLLSDCASACAKVSRSALIAAARAWKCTFPVYCTLELCARSGHPTGIASADFVPEDPRLEKAARGFIDRVAARGRGCHNEVYSLECQLAGGMGQRLRFLLLTAFPYPEVMRCIYSAHGSSPLVFLYWRRIWGRIRISIARGCRRILRPSPRD